MEKIPLYTIGHSTRKAEKFLDLLKQNGIKYLADVRSRPYSRFNPQYNQKALKSFLEENGITYVFMGDTLGGRPEDTSCYDANGRIDYEKVSRAHFFRQGIERLKDAYSKSIPLAIMCSEGKPADCHRSRLIGLVLYNEGISVRHIDQKGLIRSQEEVLNGLGGHDLFSAKEA